MTEPKAPEAPEIPSWRDLFETHRASIVAAVAAVAGLAALVLYARYRVASLQAEAREEGKRELLHGAEAAAAAGDVDLAVARDPAG